MNKSALKFAFFGSSRLSVIVLDELSKLGFIPACVVTTPDKPQGRQLTIAPNVVKTWAIDHKVKVYDPEKLNAEFIESLKKTNCDLFVVASYGKIIPQVVLDIPVNKVLNIHPSLLPKYRGPSPLPTAILEDTKETGVTIMRLDAEMDHGPIVAAKKVMITEWPTYEVFEEMMAKEGAQLLAQVMPEWVAGYITEQVQDHTQATYTKKVVKEDGHLDLSADPYLNFRKIQAFHEWPQAYFFIERGDKQLRVKVTAAEFSNGKLTIKRVIPEGKKEMSYKDFEAGYGK